MTDSFIVYRSFYESIKDFDAETRLAFYDALMEFGINENEVPTSGIVKALLTAVKPQITANAKRREHGNLGGRPKKGSMVTEEKNHRFSKTKTIGYEIEKPNENVNVNENENVNVNANANANANDNGNDNDNVLPSEGTKKEDTVVSKKEPKHKYGMYSNVLLTDTEFDKLKEEFPRDWNERIDRLSEYIESKGAKYKNHLATIRAWARKDKDTAKEKKRTPFSVIDDMDFSEPLDSVWTRGVGL